MSDSENTTTTTPPEVTTTTPPPTPDVLEVPVAAAAAPVPVASVRKQLLMQYGIATAIVLAMGLGLWYILESEGRLQTNVFATAQTMVFGEPAAVVVNGKKLPTSSYQKNYDQLTAQATTQGLDPTDPAVAAEIKTQAVDLLVNSELLRQAALAAGIVVTPEQQKARYDAIVSAQGGEEALKTKMAELGITEDSLNTDIEQEILIQTHIAAAIDMSQATVTTAEVEALYNSVSSNPSVDVPPLAEVRPQIEQELLFGKEQELIKQYIDTLKENATIEVLI